MVESHTLAWKFQLTEHFRPGGLNNSVPVTADGSPVSTGKSRLMSLGVQSKPMLKDRLTLRLVGQNLMGSLKYDKESNDLPMAIKAGAGYEIKKNWTAVGDMTFPKGADSNFSVGTEYRLT